MIKKPNIFTAMMMIASFAVVLRLFDLSSFSMPHSAAESTPAPQQFEQVNSAPPTTLLAQPASAPVPDSAEKKADAPADAHADGNPAAAPPVADSFPPASNYGEHAYSAAELDVLQSLSKRRDELDKRDQELGRHEALLKAAESEVDRKIAELNKIKGELVELLNKQQAVQGERVNSLVKIYEGMKPKEAARIFDTLDMDVLLAVISKMSERKSSPIIAAMDPEKARLVTIKLTEQHKLPDMPDDSKKAKSQQVKAETPSAAPSPASPAASPAAAFPGTPPSAASPKPQ